MLIINIFLQLLVGITILLGYNLDYSKIDSGTIEFKKKRRLLFILGGVIIVLSIFLSVYDHFDAVNYESHLISNIDSLNNKADTLDAKLAPFLKLALDKYPNIDEEARLDSLINTITYIDSLTDDLIIKERRRETREKEISLLKRTPPKVDFELKLDEVGLWIVADFKNAVPILFQPQLYRHGIFECDNQEELIRIFNTAEHDNNKPVLYPPNSGNGKVEFLFDYSRGQEIPIDKQYCIRMIILHESIYYKEIHDPKLKKDVVFLDYIKESGNLGLTKTKFID